MSKSCLTETRRTPPCRIQTSSILEETQHEEVLVIPSFSVSSPLDMQEVGRPLFLLREPGGLGHSYLPESVRDVVIYLFRLFRCITSHNISSQSVFTL